MQNQDRARRGRRQAKPPDPDVFRVLLSATNREALARIVRQHGLDIDHSHPRKGEPVEVHAFLTASQIEGLKREGWDLRVEENLSEIGRERQQEVGKGDRFEGGKIAPTGLGRKTAEER